MTTVTNVHVGGPQLTQETPPTGPTGQTGQTTTIQPPPLRTPQEVLAESKQKFPQMDELVLRGQHGIPGFSPQQLTMLEHFAQRPVQGMVPVLIGQGANIKVALMPTAGVPGPDPSRTIQQYVLEGQDLYNRIMAGDMQIPHGKEEVAKVMWFLQALGSAKASESSGNHPPAPALFKEGSFSVEDPDHRLEQFLFTANSYERSSSHLSEFQSQPGCHPRGVDIRGVPMPNERKTVMFARMPGSTEVRNSRDPNMGDKGMLFIKMEPHGCRGFSTGGTGRTGEAGGFFKSVKRFFANIADTLGHALGFTQSLGQRLGLIAIEGQNNRERVPGDVKNTYNAVKEQAQTLSSAPGLQELPQAQRDAVTILARRFDDILGQGAPLSSTGGIRVMVRNLEEVQKQYLDMPESLRNTPELTAFGTRLNDALALLRGHGDHPEHRIGNEIVLMQNEMTVGNPVVTQRPNHAVSRQGGLSQNEKELILAGYRYIVADIENHDMVGQFELDAPRCTYHIGVSGHESTYEHDLEGSKAAVLALAGGNQWVANILMSIAHQSFAEPITNAASMEIAKSFLGVLMSGSSGDLRISKMPDSPDGNPVYRIGYTTEKIMGNNEGIQPIMGQPDLRVDREHSPFKGEMWLDLTFYPNGAVEPSFGKEPSFSFTLTPEQA